MSLSLHICFCDLGLPKPPHVKQVFEGPNGLLAGMGPGKVWIDHSTTDHEQNKVFTAELTKKGGELLECPKLWVAGNKVTCLVSCLNCMILISLQEAYLYVKPVLDASYNSVMYTDALGTAMIP